MIENIENKEEKTGEIAGEIKANLNILERKKGRPVRSAIRTNIIEILHHGKKMHGYDVYKAYVAIFPRVTMRSIYYNLKKGLDIGEFEVESIKMEKGNFSWGGQAEKTYYKLGTNARPIGVQRVKDFFEGRKD